MSYTTEIWWQSGADFRETVLGGDFPLARLLNAAARGTSIAYCTLLRRLHKAVKQHANEDRPQAGVREVILVVVIAARCEPTSGRNAHGWWPSSSGCSHEYGLPMWSRSVEGLGSPGRRGRRTAGYRAGDLRIRVEDIFRY